MPNDKTEEGGSVTGETITDETKTYVCIDLKSFYASVEAVERGMDPMTENLVVADPSRGRGRDPHLLGDRGRRAAAPRRGHRSLRWATTRRSSRGRAG